MKNSDKKHWADGLLELLDNHAQGEFTEYRPEGNPSEIEITSKATGEKFYVRYDLDGKKGFSLSQEIVPPFTNQEGKIIPSYQVGSEKRIGTYTKLEGVAYNIIH